MKKSAGIIVVAAFLAFSGCEKRPDGVISESKLVDIMADMELADAYNSANTGGGNRISRDVLEASVLKKHGVTQAELDSTVMYYGRNIDDYYKLYAKVEQKLRKRSRNGESEKKAEENNMWPYIDYAMVLPNQASDGIVFSMPLEGLEKGASLEWRLRLTTADGVETMLGVEYDNGSSSIIKRNAGGNKSLKIALQTDTAQTVKRVFGVMSLPSRVMPVYVDSIRLVKMDYDSLAYSRINQQRKIGLPRQKPKTVEIVDTL